MLHVTLNTAALLLYCCAAFYTEHFCTITVLLCCVLHWSLLHYYIIAVLHFKQDDGMIRLLSALWRPLTVFPYFVIVQILFLSSFGHWVHSGYLKIEYRLCRCLGWGWGCRGWVWVCVCGGEWGGGGGGAERMQPYELHCCTWRYMKLCLRFSFLFVFFVSKALFRFLFYLSNRTLYSLHQLSIWVLGRHQTYLKYLRLFRPRSFMFSFFYVDPQLIKGNPTRI